MKKYLTILLSLVMISSLFGCAKSSEPQAAQSSKASASSGSKAESESEYPDTLDRDNPIYIGVIEAMTGEKAMSGMYTKEGADMAVKHINSKGGVLGRELVVLYEDDQGNETVGTNAYQKITAEYDLTGTILSKFSSVVLAVEPFVEQAEIPAICAGSSINIANNENEWLYSLRKSDFGSGISIANAAADQLKMTKVAILHAPDALGTGLAPVIQKQLEEKGVEVVSVQQFSMDEKNFAPFIAKIASSGCDGIVSVAQQTEAALIMTAIKEANLDNLPRIGGSAFCQQTALQNAGENANGWYSVTAWSPTVSTEPAKSWIEEYVSLYGQEPDMSSALAYDSLLVFSEAIEKAGSSDPAAVNEALKQIKDFQGISSTYSYDPETRMMAQSEYLAHIENGKSIIIDTIFS